MRPDLVAVTSTTRPSTVASTAAIQLSAPLWGASAMACMSAPSPDARSQGEPSHQIERGALVRMHHRGLERRSEFEVPPGNERTEPEPAANSGVPSGRALVGDEDASDVGQPEHAEPERECGVESADRDLKLRVADHGRVAREPVQGVPTEQVARGRAGQVQRQPLRCAADERGLEEWVLPPVLLAGDLPRVAPMSAEEEAAEPSSPVASAGRH